MDISSYLEMKDKGYQYYDYDKNPVELLDFAKKQGFNYVRLRIWNDPSFIEETGGYCDLEKTLYMAKLIKEYDYGFFLDFHYSDWWADPGHQKKPHAWEHLGYPELKEALYHYTKEVLLTLEQAGAAPDMVQIGNEIRTGMLFPDGAVQNWPGLAGLINSGIRAVREVLPKEKTKLVLHLDQGGRYAYYKEWFDAALQNGVKDFDIIALSYYPFWHGTFYEFKNTVENLAEEYGKDLLVAETAYAFQRSGDTFFRKAQEQAAGFSATPENQRKVLELIENIIANVREERGLGFFYWEPFMRMPKGSEGWGSCMALADEGGKATEGLRAIAYDAFKKDKEKIVKVYLPLEVKILPNADPVKEGVLPAKVKALKMNGELAEKEILWQDTTRADSKTYEITGKVEGYEELVKVRVKVEEQQAGQHNFLHNAAFAKGMEGWKLEIEEGKESFRAEIYIDGKQSNELPDERIFSFRSESICKWVLGTKSEPLNRGTYSFSCQYMGDNTTGVEISLFAKTKGKYYQTSIFPQDKEWISYKIEDIQVQQDEAVEVGLSVNAPPVYGKVKQFKLWC